MNERETIQNKLDIFTKAFSACPDLIYLGQKSLREKSLECSLEEGREIAEKLKTVLLKYREVTGLGRGAAAPQIGINKRVFVTYVDNVFQTYINPKIIEKSDSKNFYRELCMSSGLFWGDVKRSEKIRISWTDENENSQEKEAEGFLARLLQHEYDHLEGIANLDVCEGGSIEFVMSNPIEEKLRNE